jgi:N-acetylneuraminate synthase
MDPFLEIGDRPVGPGRPAYVIAEIGVNHEGSLERARRMVRDAARAGADAVKFQIYRADELAVADSPAYWDRLKEPTATQRELFRKYDRFGSAEYQALVECAAENKVHFLATPFDLEAVELIESWVPAYKIASADLVDVRMLRAVAGRGVPVLLSTGACDEAEITRALEELRSHGDPPVGLLHCVLQYPTPEDHAALGLIPRLRERFPQAVPGYSDHTLPDEFMTALVTACALGACVIEKHFTDDKSAPGNDHYHAMDAVDLEVFREREAELRMLLGDRRRREPLPGELAARRHARRSVVAARDLAPGELLGPDNLTCKRPGSGISAADWDRVCGCRAARAVPADTLLTWEMVAR